MRIKNSIIALGLLAVCGLSSCRDSSTKSLSELKDEQSDAIKDFRNSNRLNIVSRSDNTLPGTIDTSVYYHLKNGLYIRVLDQGDKTHMAKENETHVFMLMKGYMFGKETSQTMAFDNLSKASVPELEFLYTYYYNAGDVHYTAVPNARPLDSYDSYMCEGLAFPASILGNGARVSLIIPFEIGPSSAYRTGLSTYVEEVRYTYR